MLCKRETEMERWIEKKIELKYGILKINIQRRKKPQENTNSNNNRKATIVIAMFALSTDSCRHC